MCVFSSHCDNVSVFLHHSVRLPIEGPIYDLFRKATINNFSKEEMSINILLE